MLTCTAKPIDVGAIENVVEMGNALKCTTVTGGVVMVDVTRNIIINTLQIKKHLLYKFFVAEDSNTCRRVIVNSPGGRSPATPGIQHIWTSDIQMY